MIYSIRTNKNNFITLLFKEVTSKDAHKLKLARLDWELNERKIMKAKIKSLEGSIEKYQNECKEKHEQLESFNPRLNKIIDVNN